MAKKETFCHVLSIFFILSCPYEIVLIHLANLQMAEFSISPEILLDSITRNSSILATKHDESLFVWPIPLDLGLFAADNRANVA